MPPKDCKNNKIAEHNWKQSCYGIVDVFVKLERGNGAVLAAVKRIHVRNKNEKAMFYFFHWSYCALMLDQ